LAFVEIMRIGVIGARLSGSYASLLLGRMGHEVLLFDYGADKEKPCGGGVTAKALQTMPLFQELGLPNSKIDMLLLLGSNGYKCKLPLRTPMRIYTRQELDASIRTAALKAGARFIPERAAKFMPENHGWVISTTAGHSHEVDFLVGADGANSSVRASLVRKYGSSDLVIALGYYLPGVYHPNTAVAAFQEYGFPGYIWSFPRADHSSVGIGCRLTAADSTVLRKRLHAFMSDYYPDAREDRRFFAARIPCLSRQTLINQHVCGPNWALVGDAAGFVDAITSEGIYFALRSAELLAGAISSNAPMSYETSWRSDFGRNLLTAAAWRDWFYAGQFFSYAVTRRTVQAMAYSRTIRSFVDTVISGGLSYKSMRTQLILHIPRIFAEVFVNRFAKGMIARENGADL
jgi:flavin-dependent dehydrogenase